ncbi:hypothetical protein OCO53_23335 [Peribacillus frigoritolerans]|uniref:hypothetical protein n=1 Tax=Peribacillus frigoritolerans TaxID=450367 RepID=UPI0021D19120|nr:hypothetical protein [Peribacillus frigoritolerans]MCU6603378.1 hypothetical protein [Peribacillus frigoritolerans]
MVEKILGLFFEKRKQNKKDVLSLILIFALCIVNIVGYFTDMDLFWLSGIVSIAIIAYPINGSKNNLYSTGFV